MSTSNKRISKRTSGRNGKAKSKSPKQQSAAKRKKKPKQVYEARTAILFDGSKGHNVKSAAEHCGVAIQMIFVWLNREWSCLDNRKLRTEKIKYLDSRGRKMKGKYLFETELDKIKELRSLQENAEWLVHEPKKRHGIRIYTREDGEKLYSFGASIRFLNNYLDQRDESSNLIEVFTPGSFRWGQYINGFTYLSDEKITPEDNRQEYIDCQGTIRNETVFAESELLRLALAWIDQKKRNSSKKKRYHTTSYGRRHLILTCCQDEKDLGNSASMAEKYKKKFTYAQFVSKHVPRLTKYQNPKTGQALYDFAEVALIPNKIARRDSTIPRTFPDGNYLWRKPTRKELFNVSPMILESMTVDVTEETHSKTPAVGRIRIRRAGKQRRVFYHVDDVANARNWLLDRVEELQRFRGITASKIIPKLSITPPFYGELYNQLQQGRESGQLNYRSLIGIPLRLRKKLKVGSQSQGFVYCPETTLAWLRNNGHVDPPADTEADQQAEPTTEATPPANIKPNTDQASAPAQLALSATAENDTLPDDPMLSLKDIGDRFDLTKLQKERLRQRLIRWMPKNGNSYFEVANRRPREPRYLYRLSAVFPMIRELSADDKLHDETYGEKNPKS